MQPESGLRAATSFATSFVGPFDSSSGGLQTLELAHMHNCQCLEARYQWIARWHNKSIDRSWPSVLCEGAWGIAAPCRQLHTSVVLQRQAHELVRSIPYTFTDDPRDDDVALQYAELRDNGNGPPCSKDVVQANGVTDEVN